MYKYNELLNSEPFISMRNDYTLWAESRSPFYCNVINIYKNSGSYIYCANLLDRVSEIDTLEFAINSIYYYYQHPEKLVRSYDKAIFNGLLKKEYFSKRFRKQLNDCKLKLKIIDKNFIEKVDMFIEKQDKIFESVFDEIVIDLKVVEKLRIMDMI